MSLLREYIRGLLTEWMKATKKNVHQDGTSKSRGYMSGKDVSWIGKDVNDELHNWYKKMGLMESRTKVLGYLKPSSSFQTLFQWELVVEELLDLQKQGIDTRGGLDPNERLAQIIDEYFGFQYHTEVERYDLLTEKNVLDFVEDFANHRFWGLDREFNSYFPNIDKLKFSYFYSRGDLEPYVLMDDEFTTQLYGSLDNHKKLSHYTNQAGVERIQSAIDSGRPFDISCFTVAERPFFRSESNLIVELIGNVRGGFRSDIKSVAIDTGRRACNMHRLEYPGKDQDNICRELDSCDGEVKTSLWNEYIATPVEIISVRKT